MARTDRRGTIVTRVAVALGVLGAAAGLWFLFPGKGVGGRHSHTGKPLEGVPIDRSDVVVAEPATCHPSPRDCDVTEPQNGPPGRLACNSSGDV